MIRNVTFMQTDPCQTLKGLGKTHGTAFMTVEKVGIAMSGGVDSSVTASILKNEGIKVYGFFMNLPLPGMEKHIKRVTAVADQLNIPLEIVPLKKYFSHKVIEYFKETYMQGLTPNPCVICNRQVKFGYLLRFMLERGMNKIATGHYARLSTDRDCSPLLKKGVDPKKDQSYFLCRLTSDQLKNMILPLGSLTKKEVYSLAAEKGLGGVHGAESQDICFLAGETVASFFEKQGIKNRPGDIVTTEGKTIGQHQGLWRYTIGQRRGLALPDTTPWYVYHLDAMNNHVVVCKNEMLFKKRVRVRDMQWTFDEPAFPFRAFVKIRGSHQPSAASVRRESDSLWTIAFDRPQRAVTPGQFAVLYNENDMITGSGIIMEHVD